MKPQRSQRNTLYYEHAKSQNFVEKNLIGKPASETPQPPFIKLIVSHMLGGWTQGE